jgi:hypothetical protein
MMIMLDIPKARVKMNKNGIGKTHNMEQSMAVILR